MPGQGYNYNFKMLLEGVEIPFKSIQIMCTPNGVEANINLLSNKQVFDLKPKTAVQVFFKDWVNVKGKLGWRLMFDGFLSSYFKSDNSTQGRGLGILCRDFRMDIRKSPAALSWFGKKELSSQQYYWSAGLFRTWVVRGITPKAKKVEKVKKGIEEEIKSTEEEINDIKSEIEINKKDLGAKSGPARPQGWIEERELYLAEREKALADLKKKKQGSKKTGYGGVDIRTWGNSGLNDLSFAIGLIAGVAYGKGLKRTEDDKFIYSRDFGKVLPEDEKKRSKGAFFLDAVIRGMWTEAVGGTSIGAFHNKRIRVDKRFMIPKNETGYNFWSRQSGGLQMGSVIMGNSRFSSLEAAIMRLAGLFSVRVYSCNSPSLIPLEDDSGKDSDALKWVMDPGVKRFLVDYKSNKVNFGGKYILNETMLLPPLEFTAPPNCNLIFPPMCDNVKWQYDMDADITRGYFKQIDTLTTKKSTSGLTSRGVQVPNALFDVYSKKNQVNNESASAQKDQYNRKKPPITLEERYKGVSVFHGSVETLLAQNDAAKSFPETTLSKKASQKVREVEDKIVNGGFISKHESVINQALQESLDAADAAKDAIVKSDQKAAKRRAASFNKKTQNALNRHALIKYLNLKYSGRVAIVDMAFNPYMMAGFPGAIIADEEAYGGESSKTVVGMVQQVKHLITISAGGAEASTSVVLNNVRFEDEPTDMDRFGNPLYMRPTYSNEDFVEQRPVKAEVDEKTREFKNKSYEIQDPKPDKKQSLNNKIYELDDSVESDEYRYAKDILTLTKKDRRSGERNSIYLDDDYSPNRIHKFYKEVFGHNEDHFMLNKVDNPDTTALPAKVLYAFETMHEGFENLRISRKELLTNYEKCIKYIYRDICSADAFYQGVLGLSIKEEVTDEDTNEKEIKYTNRTSGFSVDRIKPEYWGITTKQWDSYDANIILRKKDREDVELESLKSEKDKNAPPGKMTAPGQFSSINEALPITAFIQERKEAVYKYKEAIDKRVEGTQFANIKR